MHQTTSSVSEAELLRLAEGFGIEVAEGEVDDLLPRVNRRLEGLDEVYEIPLKDTKTSGERFWTEATKKMIHTTLL